LALPLELRRSQRGSELKHPIERMLLLHSLASRFPPDE
jgi:hypothetical protein